MRQIKFRAWIDAASEMVYDWNYEDGDSCSLSMFFNDIYPLGKHDSLMQFTGLYDKNGKEIYEGDVVQCHDHPTGIEDGKGSVYYKNGMWMSTHSEIPLGDFGKAWVSVIGNIYENPDLV